MKQILMAKAKTYKEQMSALQNTIKEHQQIREELEEKLKLETKISHGTLSLFYVRFKLFNEDSK
jgi:hypothetical protein